MIGQAPIGFEAMIAFGWIAFFLIVGVVLRQKVALFRKYMVPGCMMGGFLGLAAFNLGMLDIGLLKMDAGVLNTIVWHLYSLTFICFGLNGFGGAPQSADGGNSRFKTMMWGAFFLAFIMAMVNGLGSAIGVGLAAIWNNFFGTNVLETSGLLLSTGFIAGPAPAMTRGIIYEQAGYAGMAQLGQVYGGMGFLAAMFAGVPIANYLRRKKGVTKEGLSANSEEGYAIYNNPKDHPAGFLTLISSNTDTMTFQVCLVMGTYFLAYLIYQVLGLFVPPKVMGMLWSLYQSIGCLFVGMLVRTVFVDRLFKWDRFVDRGLHARITNVCVDLVATGALIAISLGGMAGLWGLIITGSVLCMVSFAAVIWFFSRKFNDAHYPAEHFLAAYGMACGTVSSGLVLCRIVDPEYKSTVPIEMGFFSLINMGFSLIMTPITTPFAFAQVYYGKTFWPVLNLQFVMLAIWGLALMLPFWRKTRTKTPWF